MGGGEHLNHHFKSVLATALTIRLLSCFLFSYFFFFSFKTFYLVMLPIAADFLSINYIILQILAEFDHIRLPVFNLIHFCNSLGYSLAISAYILPLVFFRFSLLCL